MARRRRQVRLAPIGAGFDGQRETREMLVDDTVHPGRKAPATVNIRAGVVDHLVARGRIGAEYKAAADRLGWLWRSADFGKVGSAQFQERVSGGGLTEDPISEQLIGASRELKKAMLVVGPAHARFLVRVIVQGQTVREAAKDWTADGGVLTANQAEGYVTGTLIDALGLLVKHWGLVALGRPAMHESLVTGPGGTVRRVRGRIRSSQETVTGPGREIQVGLFGDYVSREVVPRRTPPLQAMRGGGRKR